MTISSCVPAHRACPGGRAGETRRPAAWARPTAGGRTCPQWLDPRHISPLSSAAISRGTGLEERPGYVRHTTRDEPSARTITHVFMESSTWPPLCSIVSISCRRTSSWSWRYCTVFWRTRPSDRPWPSMPGTRSHNRSKPSRIAWRLFCSAGIRSVGVP